jgi:hypothetical protein
MKEVSFKITDNDDDDFQWLLGAYANAEKNQVFIDTFYQEFFRPVIKYGEDETKVKIYEELWQRIQDELG